MPELYSIQTAPPVGMEASRITTLPILLLNIHSQCNCRCVMCDIWKRRDGLSFKAIDLERHRESIRELAVQHVVLTGGEPLLNPEFSAICSFFQDLNIRITLLTTGLLLFKRAEAVARLVDDVIISIDGPPGIHDCIRNVPGAFTCIQKGVRELHHYSPMMPISCRTTVQKLNHARLRATVDAARSLDVNSISFLPADVASGAFNREQRWTEERENQVALTRDELYTLEAEIELLIATYRDDIASGFIVENAAKLRRLADRFRERLDNLRPQAPLCNAPWVSAVVDVDGGLRPCFFHAPVGNITHHTIEESLNGPSALAFRSTLDIANNPTCQRCVCSLNYHA